MKDLERRVAKLEQPRAQEAVVYGWQELDETWAEAVARQFPDGVADHVKIVMFCWAE